MERTWKPTVAGVLCIIVGGLFVICMIFSIRLGSIVLGSFSARIGTPLIMLGIVPIVGGIYALRRRVWGLALAGSIFALIVPVTLVIFVMSYLIGAGAAIGEVSLTFPETLARISSSWQLIGIIVVFGIPGILAVILVTKGKGEFKQTPKPVHWR